MTHLDLRRKFIEFWKEKPRNHVEIPSSSLVPENDPTTLFTGSGMQPLIPYLLGQPHPLGKRLVDIQKCFRGQDIDDVGDNSHDTFFEMMGNWSLGDYFKSDQLAWYWQFLTKELGFDPKKLYVTCFEGYKNIPKDTESEAIWKSLGVPENKIRFQGTAENWWSRSGEPENMPVGEIGGPDSEVFYEFEDGTSLEIGNSVFIQYQKQIDGSFTELPQKNVDFGGGLERTLAALNNDPDIFKTDLYEPIIENISSQVTHDKSWIIDRNFRIIADHLKAAIFLVADGIVPDNKDRGYILRRIIRRAVFKMVQMGVNPETVIEKVTTSVLKIYSSIYFKDLQTYQLHPTIGYEADIFLQNLHRGLREFEKLSAKGNLSAQEVFFLFESFGFPYELTEEEAKRRNLSIASENEFMKEFEKHQAKSKAEQGKFKGGLADHSEIVTKYHTATHLLQAALRQVSGDSVHQEGSNLTAERLRFDFSHPAKLTPEEIERVENLVNEQIKKDLPRKIETMSYDQAIASGAMAFFKERYPEKVTVYSFGDFSREICGGPHVENTGILGKFKIIKEESVASGIRRIYATLS